jgi:hypothetical protein
MAVEEKIHYTAAEYTWAVIVGLAGWTKRNWWMALILLGCWFFIVKLLIGFFGGKG